MKNAYLKSLLFVCSFISASVAVTSCAEELDQKIDEKPASQGLIIGASVSSDDNCVAFNSTSIKIKNLDMGQSLITYSDIYCGNESWANNISPIEELVGIWNGFVVLSEGSSGDSMELFLYDQSSGKKMHSIWSLQNPVFLEESIVYFEPQDKPINVELCNNEKSALTEWRKFGFEIGVADEYKFSVNNKEKTGGFTCYPMN